MKKIFVLLCLAAGAFAVEFPRTLFVENSLGRTLSSLNLETGLVQNNILTLGQVPNQLLSYRDKLYVLNSVPPEVMIIDAPSRKVLDRIALPEGSNPYNMALVGSQRMYVSLLTANAIAVVDLAARRIVKTIETGVAPQGILVHQRTALVANTGGYPDYTHATVAIIDTRNDSLTHRLSVPANPQVIRAASDFNYYVICSGKWGANSGAVAVINLWAPPAYSEPAVVDTFKLGGFPGDLMVLADGNAYVSDWGDNSGGFLYKFNIYTREIAADYNHPIHVGKGAMRLFWDKKERQLYVSNFAQDTIQRLAVEDGRVLATYPMGDGTQDMAIVEHMDDTDPWADEVITFNPGSNWSAYGYDFFPDNVLGPPDPDEAINPSNGSSNAEEILSLGDGGQIVLKFSDNVVSDGPGADFIVFENPFINFWTGQAFMEAAEVAVSQDGEHFIAFPFDTLTTKGLAGVSPVKSTQHPTDPDSSGADLFDLAELGLDWIRYVRITDLGDRWQEGLYNGDFDLDAVVAVHSLKDAPPAVDKPMLPVEFDLTNHPNPFNPGTTLRVRFDQPGTVSLRISNSTGQWITTLLDGYRPAGIFEFSWNASGLGSGAYWAVLQTPGGILTRKMLLLR